MKAAESALEKARAELDSLERKSEELFKAYRSVYYRCLRGELKTFRALRAASDDMEAAVIKAGNAYIKLREETK
jgi:hypothetical protein